LFLVFVVIIVIKVVVIIVSAALIWASVNIVNTKLFKLGLKRNYWNGNNGR